MIILAVCKAATKSRSSRPVTEQQGTGCCWIVVMSQAYHHSYSKIKQKNKSLLRGILHRRP